MREPYRSRQQVTTAEQLSIAAQWAATGSGDLLHSLVTTSRGWLARRTAQAVTRAHTAGRSAGRGRVSGNLHGPGKVAVPPETAGG